MLTSGIHFKNFKIKFRQKEAKNNLNKILKEKNQIILSLSKNYKNSFNKNLVNKFKYKKNYRLIGMGGSSLGTHAIYQFLRKKIKKNFLFFDNLHTKYNKDKKTKFTNLIISKSGNTIETIANSNILLNKKDKNIFITENKKNYLSLLADKLKAEVVEHNNFIGGRYSVLSEVGMLPAELMGLNSSKFKQLNLLVKNKNFISSLIANVSSIFLLNKKKNFNSIIINYDTKSENLFKWYQQLVAESLGKKKKGLLPIVSNMPRDNHSIMQLYLDGFQNNFYTFFFAHDKKSDKIKNKSILSSHNFLKNKNLYNILYAQKNATEKVF